MKFTGNYLLLRRIIFFASCIFLFILFNTNLAVAQKSDVTFKIVNVKKEPLPFASINLKSVNDSLLLFNEVSDSNGIARFNISYGQYVVSISSINHILLKKGITVRNDHHAFMFVAETISKTLKEVTVTASKPVMRQEDDKTIVDPENLATSSTNAYEILEKTPGLFVDQDGNIYLNSTTPAAIYINGREQKTSAPDIATMLKNLPPNSIASIEILRTPSAKYDASGSGGIVNIVLKKGVKIGLTGSMFIGGNQGKYGNRFAGLNLNNSNGNVSTYLSLNYSRRNNHEETKTDRLFAPDSSLSQDAFSLYPTNIYFLGFGLNMPLTKKWEFSYDSRINYSDFTNSTKNFSVIKKVSGSSVISNNSSKVDNNGNNFNLSQGISLKYKIDSSGSEWSTDVSYNYSPNNSDQTFVNRFYSPVVFTNGGDGKIKTRLNYFSVQSNLLIKPSEEIHY